MAFFIKTSGNPCEAAAGGKTYVFQAGTETKIEADETQVGQGFTDQRLALHLFGQVQGTGAVLVDDSLTFPEDNKPPAGSAAAEQSFKDTNPENVAPTEG